ncbi:hypothetical protein ASD13_05205 [Microbacterium sp. Root1433D1]|nr:hypothetical protein ASD13_05205 [Microbacterium sp. Root1433D1]
MLFAACRVSTATSSFRREVGDLVVGFFVPPCCACLCAGPLDEFALRGRDLPGQFASSLV